MKKEDFILNEKYNFYEVEFDNLSVRIDKENIDNVLILEYAKDIADNYLLNKKEIERYILDKGLRDYYGENNSDEEIINKIGKPTLDIIDENWCNFVWLKSTLDEHIITLEVKGEYKFHGITIDG
jgi:hypothetical protein